MSNIKNEKGSLALFVTIAMLFFMAFLLVIFISTTNQQKTQLAVTARIKETYEQDLDNVEEIYNSFIGTDEYIPIYTSEQLKKVGIGESVYISQVGKYYTFNLDSKYILKSNIELNKNKYEIAEDGTITFDSDAEQWTPIGTSSAPFTGIFDGNGYKISGLYIDNTSFDNQGLFGHNNGIIEQLTISGNIKGKNNVGGIVAFNYGNGNIKNCINECNITGSQVSGGIVGYNKGIITSCENLKNGLVYITGSYGAGGIAGRNEKTIENCKNYAYISGTNQIGGIVGNCDAATDVMVKKCINSGKVYGNNVVGGIVGGAWQTNKTTTKVTIESCSNKGEIIGNSNTGGIVGYNRGILNNNYNVGDITGKNNVGGISGSIGNPNTTDNPVGKIFNCYSYGKIDGDTYLGGIAGYCETNIYEISNCYYLTGTATGGINGADVEGQAEIKTSEEMKADTFVTLLNNGENNWKIVSGKNDGYPILSWQN